MVVDSRAFLSVGAGLAHAFLWMRPIEKSEAHHIEIALDYLKQVHELLKDKVPRSVEILLEEKVYEKWPWTMCWFRNFFISPWVIYECGITSLLVCGIFVAAIISK